MQKDRDATVKAAGLDKKIEDLRKEVEDPERLKAANQDADPQSKSMAKAFGGSEALYAMIGHVIFAIGVEIGSGLLPWLLFGHGKREETPILEPASAAMALAPPEPIKLVETPESVRQRFFDEVVLPWLGERVQGSIVYIAYARWCIERNLPPMTPHAFGLEPPWDKDKIGGNVWYLNCRLAEAYAQPQLRLAVSNE